MRKFKVWAGLGGGFGGAEYQGIYEYRNEDDALNAAYRMAFEDYESYGGMHGLLDYEGVYEDLKESGWFEDTIDENEIDDMVTNKYIEYADSWLDYRVEEVEDLSNDLGPDIDHDTYNDDNADCYCE